MDEHQYFDVTVVGDVTVMRFRNWRIIEDFEGVPLPALRDELFAIIKGAETKRFVLNFSKVQLFTSAAITILLNVKQILDDMFGEIKFCGVNDNIQTAFQMCGITQIFPMFDEESDAIASF